MEKVCLNCQKSFIATRKDKRFCQKKCEFQFYYKKRLTYFKARWQKYYKEHREELIQRSRLYQTNHPEQWKKINNKATRRYKDKTRFGGLRNFILKRDHSKCVLCGATTKLDIHHKDGSGGTKNVNNNKENLVTLCHFCHLSLRKNA